jgi:hypothetical protein
MKHLKFAFRGALAIFIYGASFSYLYAQGTAFTYQGQLGNSGVPANGNFNFVFTLFATNTGGTPVGIPVTNSSVAVANGLFTVTVDFGAGVFTGSNYWLDIAVRTNEAGTFTDLTPRQLITATPYSIMAGSASNLLGTLPASQLPGSAVTNAQTGVVLSGTFTGNGAGLTNVGAANLSGTLLTNSLPLQLTSWLIGQNFNDYQYWSGAPERDYTNLYPRQKGEMAFVDNTAFVGLYYANSTTQGDYQANFIINGILQVGTQSNMLASTYLGGGMTIWANGNTNYQNTNGPTGTELTLLVEQPDPKQAAYINFSAPSSGSGWNNIVMSHPQDAQIGMGGWVYGTNTLGGLAIGNDFLFAMNPNHDFHFTTTVDRGSYGARDILSYDNLNGVWHFPVDVVGNGAFKNTGYRDLAVFDARQQIITMTNATINLGMPNSGVPALTIDDSGDVSLVGDEITIGGDIAGSYGRGNFGSISGGYLWLNSTGNAGYSTLSFGAELNELNRVPFINEDTNGNLQIGIYPNGTMQAFDVNGHFVDFVPAVAINTTNAPNPSALLDLNNTTNKGLLLMNMTKAQRNAIPSPAAGLMIFQTDNTPGLRTFNGSNWVRYTETTDN